LAWLTSLKKLSRFILTRRPEKAFRVFYFPFQILDFDKQCWRRINAQQGLALFELIQSAHLGDELGLTAFGVG
jgi:hypothetical protein